MHRKHVSRLDIFNMICHTHQLKPTIDGAFVFIDQQSEHYIIDAKDLKGKIANILVIKGDIQEIHIKLSQDETLFTYGNAEVVGVLMELMNMPSVAVAALTEVDISESEDD